MFLVSTRSCSFRPSSTSSLMSFRCSSLWSLLPFSSTLFCGCPSSPLFSSWFSLPSLAIPHLSRRLLCLSLLQVPSPLVCGSFRSIVSLGGGGAVGTCPVSFFAPSCSSPAVSLTMVCCFLLFILSSVSGIFSLPSSICLGSFHPLCWWRSFPSSFLCFPYRSSFLYCLGLFAPAVLCRSSLSSMRCFVVSFLGSEFLPSGCLFPSPLSPPAWSLRVSCFLFCFRPFPLGSSLALLCVLSSGLFRHWAFPLHARSWFLFFSFLSAWCSWCLRTRLLPAGPLSGVSPLPVRLVSFGRCPVLFLSLVLLSPLPVFRVFVQRLCPLITPLPRSFCVCSLATFVGVLPG